jgi:two-component system, NarL family, nitrate/nitrite response regulator NarL
VTVRALIIDDNAEFLGVAKVVLGREGVAVVAVAATSAEALQAVREHHPDVVLVDVDLGDESGLDVAEALTREAAVPPRVVLISAHAEDDLRELIAASPAIGFLAKSQLSGSAVAALLGRSDPAGSGRDPAAR